MFARCRTLALILLVLPLTATCGPAEPTVELVPVTATPVARAVTATPLPPTATPTPPPPATAPPPAPTAPPTVEMPLDATPPYDEIPEQKDDGWQTASVADVGINPVWMTKMLESIYTGEQADEPLTVPGRGAKVLGIHDVLIVRDGKLVFEEHFYHQSPYSKHEVASVTKSFTSLLVGLAIEQGYLEGVDEKVVSFFPEYLPLEGADDQVHDLTIEDLLTMRHGWECDDHDPASRTYYGKDHPLDRSDLVETILYFPSETVPGTSFSYCTSGTYVLNAILTKATGMRVSSFAQQVLFEPLGIGSVTWIPFWGGWADIGGVQYMHPRDMAKIGQLVLQNGSWEGEQVVPEDWIRRSTQEHSTLETEVQPSWGRGYGYLWWLGDPRIVGSSVRSICALGGWQQVIAIFPELDLVVVINGGDDETYAGQVYQIMEDFILPAVLGY